MGTYRVEQLTYTHSLQHLLQRRTRRRLRAPLPHQHKATASGTRHHLLVIPEGITGPTEEDIIPHNTSARSFIALLFFAGWELILQLLVDSVVRVFRDHSIIG